MKKIVLAVLITGVITVTAFAQNYTVEKVTGRVQREVGSARTDVKNGETLAQDTVIFTAIGAALILNDGDKSVTVPAARSGKVAELTAAGVQTRINGNIARTNGVSRTTSQILAASARASEFAQEENIAFE